MMDVELNRCGCGGAPALYAPDAKSETKYAASVVCHHCGVSMQMADHDSDPKRVVAAWGQAYPDPKIAEGQTIDDVLVIISTHVTGAEQMRARARADGNIMGALVHASESAALRLIAKDIADSFRPQTVAGDGPSANPTNPTGASS